MLEIYADLWCPFAHLGLRAAARLRDELNPGDPLVIRAWPLELVNGIALDATKTKTNVDALQASVAPELFLGFKARVMPNSTLQALALVESANDLDPVLGERIGLGLRNLLFEHGIKIDNPELLEGIAQQNGLRESVINDTDRVIQRWSEGVARGVKGSPHFFFGETNLFCPLLDLSRNDQGALRVSEDIERLSEFLVSGFSASS